MPADPLKLAFLVPAPDFEEEWRWAFDAEAAALVAGGVEVDPIPWTVAGDLSGYDLVLPLVTWGYFERPDEWFACLDRLERESLPVVTPPAHGTVVINADGGFTYTPKPNFNGTDSFVYTAAKIAGRSSAWAERRRRRPDGVCARL